MKIFVDFLYIIFLIIHNISYHKVRVSIWIDLLNLESWFIQSHFQKTDHFFPNIFFSKTHKKGSQQVIFNFFWHFCVPQNMLESSPGPHWQCRNTLERCFELTKRGWTTQIHVSCAWNISPSKGETCLSQGVRHDWHETCLPHCTCRARGMRAFDFLGAYMHDENGPGQTNLTAGQLHLAVYPVSVTTQLAGNRPRADAKTISFSHSRRFANTSQNRITQKILTGTTQWSVQHLVCLHALSTHASRSNILQRLVYFKSIF